ncbi:hypothetical protein ACTGZD_04570 [Streptococcus parasuis]|uniref:hypothetical protein n=1 Tax=Streptococcus parasuis TaxID=1501662 RepID=UPI0040637D2D
MSFLSKLKEQPLILLATVGITAATIGFAGGMGVGKLSNSTSTQSQSTSTQSQSTTVQNQSPEGFDKSQIPNEPGQGGGRGGQGMTPPDATSGASQSDSTTSENSSSSDEVNELKKRNEEIKAQIENEDSTTE